MGAVFFLILGLPLILPFLPVFLITSPELAESFWNEVVLVLWQEWIVDGQLFSELMAFLTSLF